jgi:hypothetical protein
MECQLAKDLGGVGKKQHADDWEKVLGVLRLALVRDLL